MLRVRGWSEAQPTSPTGSGSCGCTWHQRQPRNRQSRTCTAQRVRATASAEVPMIRLTADLSRAAVHDTPDNVDFSLLCLSRDSALTELAAESINPWTYQRCCRSRTQGSHHKLQAMRFSCWRDTSVSCLATCCGNGDSPVLAPKALAVAQAQQGVMLPLPGCPPCPQRDRIVGPDVRTVLHRCISRG